MHNTHIYSSRFLWRLVQVLLVFTFSFANALACTHYVSPDGSDSYDGSSPDFDGINSGPYETLGFAFKQLVAGSTLCLRGGTYKEDSIGIKAATNGSGTEGLPITVTTYNDEESTISLTGFINIYDVEYWVFDGLRFQDSYQFRLGNWFITDTDTSHTECSYIARNITFRNNTFQHGTNEAFNIRCATDIVIQNNLFDNLRSREQGKDRHAIHILLHAENITIEDNTFRDIGGDGIQFGIRPTRIFSNIIIQNNEFMVMRPYQYRDHTGEFTPSDPQYLGNVGENGVDIKAGSRDPLCTPESIKITGNSFHGFRPSHDGVQDASGDNGTGLVLHYYASCISITNNLFYDNTRHLTIAASSNETEYLMGKVNVHGNIMHDTVQPGPPRDSTPYSIELHKVVDVSITNNTIFNTQTALYSGGIQGENGGVFRNNLILDGDVQFDAARPQNWNASNNGWWSGMSPPAQLSDVNTDVIVTASPINAADQSPLPGSDIINAGADLDRDVDYYGYPLDDQPDIGAVEFYDPDLDGITSSLDNCPTVWNPDQANVDGDPFGDVCDEDGVNSPAITSEAIHVQRGTDEFTFTITGNYFQENTLENGPVLISILPDKHINISSINRTYFDTIEVTMDINKGADFKNPRDIVVTNPLGDEPTATLVGGLIITK